LCFEGGKFPSTKNYLESEVATKKKNGTDSRDPLKKGTKTVPRGEPKTLGMNSVSNRGGPYTKLKQKI